MTHRLIKSGWHYTFGWLRRPELDDANGYCYEQPDGDLIFTDNILHSVRLYLDCLEDCVTGERYVAFTRLPARRWAKASK